MSASSPEVIFLAPDPAGASARVRLRPLLEALEGYRCQLLRLPGRNAWGLRGPALLRELAGRRPFAIVLQRHLLDPLSLLLLGRGSRLILDLDDAVWTRPWGKRVSPLKPWRLGATLRRADAVVCGSEWLAQASRPHSPNVHVIPGLPPDEVFELGRSRAPGPDGPTRLVWTGSRATLPYLQALGPVLARLAARHRFHLDVVSDLAPPLPRGVDWTHLPWSEAAELAALERAELGLYPLFGDPWSRGKCAYKVQLYMASGLPTVAARFGGGAEVLEGEAAGWLVAGPERLELDEPAWERALEQALASPDRRRARGEQAQVIAEKRLEANSPALAWTRLLDGLRD